jgi:hypothetical protein
VSFDPALFANPPAEFRPVPFWSWNDHLDVERLIEQQRSLRRAGMGGFFMHSRPGIMTPFLSDEWFAAIKACIEEARASGMQAWLYDEWSFPSGFAGGAVTETRPELARKWLLCRPYQPGATGLKAGLEIEQETGRKTELKTPFKTETCVLTMGSTSPRAPEPPVAPRQTQSGHPGGPTFRCRALFPCGPG